MSFPFDLSGTVAAFAVPGGVALKRREPATNVDGFFVPPSAATSTLDPAVVMPTNGRELLTLPALKTREVITVITAALLRTADDPRGVMADVITYRGLDYEVQRVERWDLNGNFYRAYCAKVEA